MRVAHIQHNHKYTSSLAAINGQQALHFKQSGHSLTGRTTMPYQRFRDGRGLAVVLVEERRPGD